MNREDFEDETRTIEEMAQVNNIRMDVKKIIRRKTLRNLLSDPSHPRRGPQPNSQRRNWLRLPYLGRSSDLLAKELSHHGYSVGFYPLLTLSNLSTLKDPVPPSSMPGIYELSCSGCTSNYIGQTGRAFKARLAEHRLHYNQLKSGKRQPTEKDTSAMALHCFRAGHDFDNINTRMIHKCEKGGKMNRFEETETLLALKLSGKNLLNDLTATYTTPFIRYILKIDDSTLQ
jgi:hypothetical protein